MKQTTCKLCGLSFVCDNGMWFTTCTCARDRAEKLKALVAAAIKLAIIRHDLSNDDCPTFGEAEAEVVAVDVWEALNGVGTCSEEVSPELADLLE